MASRKPQQQDPLSDPTKPVAEVRINTVKGTVWANEVETGTRYNVVFGKLYRQEDQWKTTSSFGRDDLLTLAKVVDLAHTRILKLQEEGKANSVVK